MYGEKGPQNLQSAERLSELSANAAPRAKADDHDRGAAGTPPPRRRRRTRSTATRDSRVRRSSRLLRLGRFPLAVALVDRLLLLADVVARQLPGLGQLRHHRQRAAAEEAQNLVE